MNSINEALPPLMIGTGVLFGFVKISKYVPVLKTSERLQSLSNRINTAIPISLVLFGKLKDQFNKIEKSFNEKETINQQCFYNAKERFCFIKENLDQLDKDYDDLKEGTINDLFDVFSRLDRIDECTLQKLSKEEGLIVENKIADLENKLELSLNRIKQLEENSPSIRRSLGRKQPDQSSPQKLSPVKQNF